MALTRIKKGDKIIIVDMECGTNLNYLQYPYGDMWDELHPYRTGYTKMAETWFSALEKILPIPTTRGADQPEDLRKREEIHWYYRTTGLPGARSSLWKQGV
jgi:hypothetical protein